MLKRQISESIFFDGEKLSFMDTTARRKKSREICILCQGVRYVVNEMCTYCFSGSKL